MELPASFAEYDLINDAPCAGQLGLQDAPHLPRGPYLDTSHLSDQLGFITPTSYSNSSHVLSQQCTSSATLSRSYFSHDSSLHSSLGSTESYCSSRHVPYTSLHMHSAAQHLLGQPSTCDAFSFVPIDPVVTLEPQPSSTHAGQEALHEGVFDDPHTSSMLHHPDVANHLRELSECFLSGAAQQHMSQLLDWQSQATGSPSQSLDSTTPSCNSTYTRTARPPSQVQTPGRFASAHDQFLHCSSNFVQPLQPLRPNAPQHNFASLLTAKPAHTPVYNKRKAVSSSDAPTLGNSSAAPLDKQSSFLSHPRTPVTITPPQHQLDDNYDSPDQNPLDSSAFITTPGPSVAVHDSPTTKLTESPTLGATPAAYASPTKKPLPATAQPGSSRAIRQRTASRRVTYLEDVDMSSDYEAPPSKAKPRKAQMVQRPRRHNSKPTRFCEQSESEEDSDEGKRRHRKHHNPWSMEETWALIQGVEECGGNKWADIKRRNLKAIEKRTAVDLKDKWRNLLRLAVASSAGKAGKADKRRELPAELVQKVRLLHSLKAQQNATAEGNRPVVGILSRTSSRIKQCTPA